jgi:hypothetical protein
MSCYRLAQIETTSIQLRSDNIDASKWQGTVCGYYGKMYSSIKPLILAKVESFS